MEFNVNVLLGIIIVALITEVTVNAIKVFLPKLEFPIVQLTSIIVGVALAVLSNMDIFVAFGYPLMVQYVGCVVTGIICSLGANAIYDLLESIKDYKDRLAIAKHIDTE